MYSAQTVAPTIQWTRNRATQPAMLPRKKPRLRRWLVVSCVVNLLLVGLFSLQLLRARQLRGDFMQAQSQAQAAEAVAEENRAEVEAAREMLDKIPCAGRFPNRHFSNLVFCVTNPCTILYSVLSGEHILKNSEVL